MACDCGQASANTRAERKTLRIALVLNGAMFVVGMAAGLWAQSSGLMADALDMLTDATAYAIGLLAVTRGIRFKQYSARWTGATLMLLSVGIVVDVVRRFVFGSEPLGAAMVGFSLLSLGVNVTVLRMLARYRQGEVHMRASWICTRADVVANVGVLASGLVVLATGWRYADLLVGVAIDIYVAKEAVEIWREAVHSAEHSSALSER
ncbi:cation diffusion facilitator family transporter [Caballeronia sp. LZ062]|uniref:cation diffusion facilitator family transporter n=1 Tax=unclassified Caballeronia TaxID=2646786 RepID=UPI00285E99E6|nr:MULTISPECIES: cation diffusion facilitator family transporter [unclassified Caballeronia]MDR5855723.1 cation diffusion facilitator family transporter [Caballeronia sp. LZ050]MDR5872490.1 cation diffusion facilitator family transporter [Caballeronia sp. LZ062]